MKIKSDVFWWKLTAYVVKSVEKVQCSSTKTYPKQKTETWFNIQIFLFLVTLDAVVNVCQRNQKICYQR